MDLLDALVNGATYSCCSNETRRAILEDPTISASERSRRAAVLDRLDQKVALTGRHVPISDPKKSAAQFLPYKSLKGLDELIEAEFARHRLEE